MTVVGKILVFMNLMFALATSALIVLVFTTRESWRKEYEKARNIAITGEAAYKAERIAHENDIKSREVQITSLIEERKDLQKQIKVYTGDKTVNPPTKGKYEELNDDYIRVNNDLNREKTTREALTKELGVLKTERGVLIKQAGDAQALTQSIQNELNIERQKSVDVTIEKDSFKQKAERMQNRVEELEKNNTALTNKLNALGPQAAASASSIVNPPPVAAPRDVYGTVRAVSTQGIAVISLGSDSGISAGNKLEIYRVDAKNPRNSIYLGELVVSRTEPKQAVGQFYPKPFAKPEERLPKEGDVVSTGLGSK